MYHYDASLALEELQEDALLPHPVKLRDMILRTQLGPEEAKMLNHEFQDYLTRFGELQGVARGILEKIAGGPRKASLCRPPQAERVADEAEAACAPLVRILRRGTRARRPSSRKS